jgi:hypothetical protein
MKEDNYSIDEILLAVDQLQNKKKVNKKNPLRNKLIKKDYSEVPKNTLKLIEEAEQ